MSYDFDQQHGGMSSGTKVLLGCGAAAFLCIALICGGFIFLGFRAVDVAQGVVKEALVEIQKHADAFATKFEAQGYRRVTGQVVELNSNITEPTVYTVQAFNLNADSEASLAVMAQAAEINGRINGDLHFYGQALTLHPDAVVTGNVHIEMAQVFKNDGTVEGEIIRSEGEAPFEGMLEDLESGDQATPEAEALKPSPGDVIEKDTTESESGTGTPKETSPDDTTATPERVNPSPEVDTPDPDSPAPKESDSPDE